MSGIGNQQIVVLGGGYAGALAANRLAAGCDGVTLVNSRPEFVERVRLHQWAASTGTATRDLRDVLAAPVRLRVDHAARIDTTTGQVELASGDRLSFDRLIYAVGSTAADPDAVAGARDHGFGLAEWEDAQELRDQLDRTGPQDWVTVVGGGLCGVETAAELADTGRRVRLIAGGALLPSFGERARVIALRRLARLGVEVSRYGWVEEIGADAITVRGWEEVGSVQELSSSTTILTTGFGVPDLARTSGLTTDVLGRLVTDETLTSVDDERIVGAGDAVAPMGTGWRMSCQAAIPLGAQAADTVLARMSRRAPRPARVRFVGQAASLGRRDSVIQVTRADDTPVEAALTGRIGAAIKETICRGTVWRVEHATLGTGSAARRHPESAPAGSNRAGSNRAGLNPAGSNPVGAAGAVTGPGR